MKETCIGEPTATRRNAGLFLSILLGINLVMDGLPKVASPDRMQFFLLPITGFFVLCCFALLFPNALLTGNNVESSVSRLGTSAVVSRTILLLEALFLLLFFYQASHFQEFGYRIVPVQVVLVFVSIAVSLGYIGFSWPPVSHSSTTFIVYVSAYVGGQVLSVLNFPLSYLRSDMLPVIYWADRALINGGNPYQHFYVADRIYDFPYLPGTLLAFVPAQILHLDLRWACVLYVVAGMTLIYCESAAEYRTSVAGLIGLFVLCPYLQYRHELYTQPHFLSLIMIFVLLHRHRYAASSAVFGLSMVVSQFSWVIFPFFLLYAFRRGGSKEVARTIIITFVTAALLMMPFVHAGAGSIAHNAVGQWDRLVRPIARPMNLAFWASYVIRPSNLKWLQLFLLSGIFFYCCMKGRCADLTDTLRWMVLALLTFVLFNVLVDGYFYLMLLVPMLVYTCVANGWWSQEVSPVAAVR